MFKTDCKEEISGRIQLHNKTTDPRKLHSMNKNSYLKIFLITLCMLVTNICFGFDDKDVRNLIKQSGGGEGFIKELASSMAKTLPVNLNKYTTLVGVHANGLTINLTHVLTGYDTKKKAIDEFITFQTNKVCTGSVGRILVTENNAKYHYIYLNEKGVQLFTFDIDKRNCHNTH